jgi:hypothetical protein
MESIEAVDPEQQPDDFNLISGFYGPGNTLCWYLVIACFLIDALFVPLDLNRSDVWFKYFASLFLMMLYPVVIVGHLLIQILAFPNGDEDYLVSKLLDVLHGCTEPPGILTTRRKDLYPQVLAMNASLRIMDIFSDMCFIVGPVALLYLRRKRSWLLRWNSAELLALAPFPLGLIWCWVARIAFLWKTAGAKGVNVVIWSAGYRYGSQAGAIFMLFIFGMGTFIIVRLPWELWLSLRRSIIRSDRYWALECVAMVFCGVLTMASLAAVMFPIGMLLGFFCPTRLFFPPTGISITELDQAVPIVGGIVVLWITIYQAWRGYGQGTILPLKSNI